MNTVYENLRKPLKVNSKEYMIYPLELIETEGYGKLARLPYSIRVIMEGLLRHCNGKEVTREDIKNLAAWQPAAKERPSMPFYPGRVVLQDFTGVPVLVDLAAVRAAMAKMGGNPMDINPVIPVDLVIDHSVQVDYFGTNDAFRKNAEIEFQRNRERYEFLHWGKKAFKNFRVVPPATGIIHQVNLEYLADGVLVSEDENGVLTAYPDSLVGTDSHTTMINGLGVVGWGVGGIEAAAAMVGQPLDMVMPDVIGFKLTGSLPDGATPTDLTLTIAQMLRARGVVGKFIEFYGQGLSSLSLADRAMISNMTPEYGATMSFFPVDQQTLDYLRLTGRDEALVSLVESYTREQHLFRTDDAEYPEFTDILELDMSSVVPSLAGPKRPQDRVPLKDMKPVFRKALVTSKKERGFELAENETAKTASFEMAGKQYTLEHGSIVIAAITSCTNTSNPFVMLSAGLLAKKAVEKGLTVPAYVKTSLAPGSRVVTDYLEQTGLDTYLEKIGFNLVGYGCTTCIGNSGPLPQEVEKAVIDSKIVAASVLSGNRNFEGRVHPYSLANYLASPPLVVAYALAGTVNIDLVNQPVGKGSDGNDVYLKDIWPSSQEVMEVIRKNITPEMFKKNYASVFNANSMWNDIQSVDDELFNWDDQSTYLQLPPYFDDFSMVKPKLEDIQKARVLAAFGDSITTDHISPAGSIPVNGPAGKYLMENGVEVKDFNSFGSRRGNDRVMTRGTFGNIRLKNQLVPGVEGGVTRHFPDDEQMSIFDAAMKYRDEKIPLIVLAGKEYGTGSSRDWAAKGVMLLGVRAVIAESYERIHRSNLVGMGVMPLQFKEGENIESLGLTGSEQFDVYGINADIQPRSILKVVAKNATGEEKSFEVIARLDTTVEVNYYRNGGILQTVLYDMLAK